MKYYINPPLYFTGDRVLFHPHRGSPRVGEITFIFTHYINPHPGQFYAYHQYCVYVEGHKHQYTIGESKIIQKMPNPQSHE